MLSSAVFCLAAALLLPATSGCQKHRQKFTCEPAVGMDDLSPGRPGLSVPEDGFVLLADAHTAGRFACRLAVAKLIPQTTDEAEAGQAPTGTSGGVLRFVELRPTEQVYWVEELRGVAAISDVQFLRPRSTRPEGHSAADLCAAARKLEARLLLVYVPNGLGPNSAQVLGVLYDADTEAVLATLRAGARILDEDGEEESPNHKRGDHRATDARYRAQRAFEQHALACLRELIHRDAAPPATQPHRWQQPFIERWWMRFH